MRIATNVGMETAEYELNWLDGTSGDLTALAQSIPPLLRQLRAKSSTELSLIGEWPGR